MREFGPMTLRCHGSRRRIGGLLAWGLWLGSQTVSAQELGEPGGPSHGPESAEPTESSRAAPSLGAPTAPARRMAPAKRTAAPAQAAPGQQTAPSAQTEPAQQAASGEPGQATPSPHGGSGPPASGVVPAPGLPVGSLEVLVQDGQGNPVPGAEVQLVTKYESIAEGGGSETEKLTADASGRVRFNGLETSLRYTHSVQVDYLGAHYELPFFRTDEQHGMRAAVTVFPSSTSPVEATVGMRGFVYVSLREGLFHFDVLFRVFTLGTKTWLPQDVLLKLPPEAEAIDTQGMQGGTGFESRNGAVELVGTFPPGQRDVRFQFQIPRENQASREFELGLPPNVAELRLLAESVPGMGLDADGFEPVQEAEGPEGKPVLVTRRVIRDGQFGKVEFELDGLPVKGPERWLVTAFALAVALAGLFAAWQSNRHTEETEEDERRAQKLLLEELWALERAFESGDIGPRTYEGTKKRLLDALARLEERPAAKTRAKRGKNRRRPQPSAS